ncbi:hypothetical protein EJD97_001947 [Solanum chilense]|uniref:Uncharacterized protein n=1 Tax=Solanum chilense TaxID=4083 RepID=A0A6N2C0I8_SOLCI|nr:hypothetical protein EJD97_001947 [Solanum chilense]
MHPFLRATCVLAMFCPTNLLNFRSMYFSKIWRIVSEKGYTILGLHNHIKLYLPWRIFPSI